MMALFKNNKMRKCAHEGIPLCINGIEKRSSLALTISELLKKNEVNRNSWARVMLRTVWQFDENDILK